MQAAIEVQGTCDARFRAIKDAFRENFAKHAEVGAALCIHADHARPTTKGIVDPAAPHLRR